MTDHEPLTAAGQRLLAGLPWRDKSERDRWGAIILAIEREAAARSDDALRAAAQAVLTELDIIRKCWPVSPPVRPQTHEALRAALAEHPGGEG